MSRCGSAGGEQVAPLLNPYYTGRDRNDPNSSWSDAVNYPVGRTQADLALSSPIGFHNLPLRESRAQPLRDAALVDLSDIQVSGTR